MNEQNNCWCLEMHGKATAAEPVPWAQGGPGLVSCEGGAGLSACLSAAAWGLTDWSSPPPGPTFLLRASHSSLGTKEVLQVT